MSKPRIGVVFVGLGIFPYRICGDKNFLLDLSDELENRDFETRFISIVNGPRDLPSRKHFRFINRAFHFPTEKHVRRDAGAIIAYRHHHGLPRTWVEISATLLRHRRTLARATEEFEHVIVHWMDSSLLLPVLRQVCGKTPRYVATVFRYRAASGSGQKLRVRAMRSADRIVTGTHAARDLLLKDGCRPESTVVAPWGCPASSSEAERLNVRGNIQILWSGFLQQIGRADFLQTVNMAQRIRRLRTDIDFTFSLKPECYSADFAWYNGPGISITTGTPAFAFDLSKYDAFLSPVGDSESSSAPPLTWIEAMAASLPILTTEHPGALEVLGGGKCGIVARDYADLERLLQDPDLAARLSQMRPLAQRHHRQEYDVRQVGERYADIYSDLFSSTR